METKYYTNVMYQEDLKFANYIFNKYFSKYKSLKEDLIAEGLVTAWKSRTSFNGETKFSTYCYHNVYTQMLKIISRNDLFKQDYSLFSEAIGNNEDTKTTLGDLFEDKTFNFDDVDDYLVLQKLVIKYLKELAKPNKIYNITLMILKGFSSKEISQKCDCTISYVNRIKLEFKNKLKELINKELHHGK